MAYKRYIKNKSYLAAKPTGRPTKTSKKTEKKTDSRCPQKPKNRFGKNPSELEQFFGK